MATVIHVTKTVPVTNDAAEQILSDFDPSLLHDSVANQLERVQRDLRGLPPQRSEEKPTTNGTDDAVVE